ncbi:MAG: tRNA (uridine(34)/cytosine(34)/5-carboxymethylaminomethyluridine(34)-2'-O)-methyltransferase TrmL [Clostridia bacterium]|nr:tRNA (uridine(34)/cytosine(34)/5-carboxymethylaminomethyluridine(34)-2'-O)-methyltransferase TrmL [Clostridia bacterium]
MKLHIVMVEPEIPQNTGNIARTCAITGGKLHLVHPLGFKIDEKSVKRAGLDYWDKIDIEEHNSLEEFLKKYQPDENNMFFATTKGKTKYTDVDYSKMEEIYVLYGKETKGLPESLLEKYLDTKTIRIPMLPTLRSLNLSNSVAIITYEILRQHNFEDLQETSEYFDKK